MRNNHFDIVYFNNLCYFCFGIYVGKEIMDKHTPEQRKKNMQAVHSSGTVIETTLGKALFAQGLRYRKNNKTVFGKPDFTFKKYKIAIFADSEFWHGKDWSKKKKDHKTNKKFWINKIEGNINRDKWVTLRLRKEGWKVLRFWGKDIINNLDKCITKALDEIEKAKRNKT